MSIDPSANDRQATALPHKQYGCKHRLMGMLRTGQFSCPRNGRSNYYQHHKFIYVYIIQRPSRINQIKHTHEHLNLLWIACEENPYKHDESKARSMTCKRLKADNRPYMIRSVQTDLKQTQGFLAFAFRSVRKKLVSCSLQRGCSTPGMISQR